MPPTYQVSQYFNMVPFKYVLKLGAVICTIGILLHVCLVYMTIRNETNEAQTAIRHEKNEAQTPATIYRVYTQSVGRLGNHMFNLVGIYGLARTNHRKLVMPPKFFYYITKFLNRTYLEDFKVAVAPRSVPLKRLRYATYEPEMEHLPEKDLVLGPHAQGFRYFQPYLDDIKKILVIRNDLESPTREHLQSLHLPKDTTFVGIHVRRGDTLKKAEVQIGRQVPGPKYLQKAMLYFLSKYTKVQFIVCTDDVTWCKQNETYLQPGRLETAAEYGVHFSPGKSPEWDLALLAQCNHTIFTVGSFGWWGAWFAGGEAIYFNNAYVPGSPVDKDFTAKDYFWPTWIGMDDK